MHKASTFTRSLIGVFALVSMIAGSFSPIVVPLAHAASNYAITGSSSVSGTAVTLSGTASANPYTGQSSDQHIAVDWTGACSAGSATEFPFTSITFIGGNNGTFTGATWSTSHNFPVAGTYPVCVKVYHGNFNGGESSDNATFSASVVIPPQCADGIDNDNDGKTDFAGGDLGCADENDNTESPDPAAPATGGLVVVKNTVNNNGTFNFTGGLLGAFSITTAANTGSKSFFNLLPGAYTITETAQANWSQTSSDCAEVAVTAGATSTCTIVNTFTAPAVNEAPVAQDQSVATLQDTATSSILAATDANLDTLAYATTTGPVHGTLTLNPDTGAFTYTPNAGYTGSDSFNFAAIDNHYATSSEATVAIEIAPATEAPACSDGRDNDEDGLVDTNDPGCSGPEDTSEADQAAPQEPTLATIVVTGDTAAGENQPGWLFNRDTGTQTPYEFKAGNQDIGTGSLYVPPITNTVNGPSDKFVGELFLQTPLSSVNSISYRFNIASTTVADADQFYMSVYANFGESATDKFYDCRYDVVPSAGIVGGYTTATFDPTVATYVVTTRGGATPSPHVCPASPSGMDALDAGSPSIRAISLNVGDTSAGDLGVAGYLDTVVVNTDSTVTTYDFEPVVEQAQAPEDGNSGNGSASHRRNGSSGSFNTNGEVLGAETGPAECSEYLLGYIKPGMGNDAGEVAKLQAFLNAYEGDTLAVTGTYDQATLAAVHAFQNKYASDVLTPWGLRVSTGWVYYTTRKEINTIYCKSHKDFPLSQAQLDEIAAIKARQGTPDASGEGTTSSATISSVAGSVVLPDAKADGKAVGGPGGKSQTAAAANASSTPGWFGKFVHWLFGK